MPNPTIPAAGEAMPPVNLSRRAALAGFASLAAVGGSGAALAASGSVSPAEAEAAPAGLPESEHPWERAHRLARELADVLAEGDSGAAGPEGKWYAEIYPSSHLNKYSIAFCSISAREWPRRNVSLQMAAAIDAHKAAREALNNACGATDKVALGREPSKAAWRRLHVADRGEDRALVALCALAPHGYADRKAKARYLNAFIDDLQPWHVRALAFSQVQA